MPDTRASRSLGIFSRIRQYGWGHREQLFERDAAASQNDGDLGRAIDNRRLEPDLTRWALQDAIDPPIEVLGDGFPGCWARPAGQVCGWGGHRGCTGRQKF